MYIFLSYSLLFCIAIQDTKLMLWILTWKVFFPFLLMFGCYFSDRFWWVFRLWRLDGAGIWFWETWGWEESKNWVVDRKRKLLILAAHFFPCVFHLPYHDITISLWSASSSFLPSLCFLLFVYFCRLGLHAFRCALHQAVGVGYGFLPFLGFTPIQVPFMPSYDIVLFGIVYTCFVFLVWIYISISTCISVVALVCGQLHWDFFFLCDFSI